MESADIGDLKSLALKAYGFKSHRLHQICGNDGMVDMTDSKSVGVQP